ncbi:MAG: hypothetical protein ABJB47_01845, partial [Actinomycetota bacterium]
VPGATGRYVMSGIYAVLALGWLVAGRAYLPALALPFAHWTVPARAARRVAAALPGRTRSQPDRNPESLTEAAGGPAGRSGNAPGGEETADPPARTSGLGRAGR